MSGRLSQNERGRIIDHAPKHRSTFLAFFNYVGMIAFRQISAIASEIEPGIRLAILPVGIRQLADEMSFIPTFCPRLSQV
jgi:hypothetical protein